MMRARRAAMVLAAAACSSRSAPPADPAAPPAEASAPGPEAPPAPAVAPAASVTLGDVGLEASSLDRTADPCVDFYQFACGGWVQNNPIPPDRSQWSRLAELDERNLLAIKSLLDEASRGARTTPQTRKLGDFYAACMDEPAIERAGAAALRPLIAKTLGVKDDASWLAAVIELHKLGIAVVWSQRVAADLKSSSTSVGYLEAAGLGLPDRDYYLKPERKPQLDGYERHVGKLLALAMPGGPTEAAAQAVVAIETEIARLSRSAVERRDAVTGYQPGDVRALARQAPSVDWPRYLQAVGAVQRPGDKIIVVTPALFAGLDKLRQRFRPAQWASYFTYHLVRELSVALPRAFDDEAFALQRLLIGVEQKRERSRRCVELTARALGELLGQQYVTKYVPDSSKQTAMQLVEAIARVMADEIAALPWLAEPTRQLALAKLDRLVRLVGFPERWKTYDYEVRRDDFAGNLLRALAFETHRELARAGQPVDRNEWQVDAFGVAASYSPSANALVLPAGLLQPPLFGQDRSVAANLGGLGVAIGRELSHGFDDQGAQFDADGNLRTWWQPADQAAFAGRSSCVADEYSAFEALPGKFLSGPLTLAENIADLGGIRMAFRAYRGLRKDAARSYLADGFTEDQQFFLAVGQAWCGRERTAETERRLTVDAQAPSRFRVYGALRNTKEFAGAFRCAPGTPMRPASSCSVW